MRAPIENFSDSANSAAGNTIVGFLKQFPHRRITVHAGHGHSAANVLMSRNLSIEKIHQRKETNLARITRSDERLIRLTGTADELDAICRKKLPDGMMRNGSLVGREAEIRQEFGS